jgi:hypothetical protein
VGAWNSWWYTCACWHVRVYACLCMRVYLGHLLFNNIVYPSQNNTGQVLTHIIRRTITLSSDEPGTDCLVRWPTNHWMSNEQIPSLHLPYTPLSATHSITPSLQSELRVRNPVGFAVFVPIYVAVRVSRLRQPPCIDYIFTAILHRV